VVHRTAYPRLKALLLVVARSLATTLIVFALAEAAVRGAYSVRTSRVRAVPLPYTFGDDYGPMPPWLDRLMILKADPALIWANVPNARRTYVDLFSPVRFERDRLALLRQFGTALPSAFAGNPTWSIALNAEGFRGADAPAAPAATTLRIACIGDSWTFGMNVNDDQSYPSRLAEWIRRERPGTDVEVLNYGVLGYSSFQGLRLLQDRVLPRGPAVVAIGFAMNDSEVAGYRDKDVVAAGPPPPLTTRAWSAARRGVEALESYKLLKYGALISKFQLKSTGDYLKAEAGSKAPGTVNYDAIEPWTRVSPRDFELNLREMIRLIEAQGAKAVLVDNELWDGSPYRPVLRTIASELRVPLVDSLALIAGARTAMEQELERTLGLTDRRNPPPALQPDKTTVVFRVYRGTHTVSRALSIVGTVPELGALVPNAILMRDDGTGGDQKAGDGVWSYSAPFAAGASLFYVYTNSGAPNVWEGLDVPHVRNVSVPTVKDSQPVYLPIETFGRVYMQADNWHTDAKGYDLIAQAVGRAVLSLR
jgi:lysophospholipase L1-like esterase